MRQRLVLLSCGSVALIAVLALLVAASRAIAVRTFSLESPNMIVVATLGPSHRACEGPITSTRPSRQVSIYGSAVGPPARLRIEAFPAGGSRPIASGSVQAVRVFAEWTTRLSRELPAGRPLRICVLDLRGPFALSGSAAVHPDIVMSGGSPASEFSLLLSTAPSRSLLSWLPTGFARASLWRPSWVGAWTFWLLAAGLLASFGIAAVAAVASAARTDEEDGPPPPGAPDRGIPPVGGNGMRPGARRLIRRV